MLNGTEFDIIDTMLHVLQYFLLSDIRFLHIIPNIRSHHQVYKASQVQQEDHGSGDIYGSHIEASRFVWIGYWRNIHGLLSYVLHDICEQSSRV